MIVVHLGPGLARTGGPAGYLWQLRDALNGVDTPHRVWFPDGAPPAARAQTPSMMERLRRRVIRAVTGAPRFYRPPVEALKKRGGDIDRMVRASLAETTSASEPSLAAASAASADILFAHDLATASAALDRRTSRQQVWLMLHSPMSTALYLAWNWGLPEEDWRAVLEFPDVKAWTRHEVEVCERVDRIVLPCREAADDLTRCDERFAGVLAAADIIRTGATRATASGRTRAQYRAKLRLPVDQPVGLFLGSLQAYRGFDALLGGLNVLNDPVAIPGTIAVAGPDPAAVPVHERIRALGRVEDVASLLQAVDFVVNVNRFSLFDLSIVEALEASRPILLHNSGGNRSFVSLGAGCVTVADLEAKTVAAGLDRFFTMTGGELATLGQQSRSCYEAHLRPGYMAARHLALYEDAARTWAKWRGPARMRKNA
jgi:glycosyltransferase involved in cell wall biosynthesis